MGRLSVGAQSQSVEQVANTVFVGVLACTLDAVSQTSSGQILEA
jgi:hypothetical protein